MTLETLCLGDIPFQREVLKEAEVGAVRKLLISQKYVERDTNYGPFLISIFPILIKTLQNSSDAGKLRIFTTDTLAIWLLRTSQLSSKSQDFHSKIPKVLTLSTLDYIFKFIIDYWDETGAPLAKSLKDVFNKLIILQKSFDFAELFQSWIDQALLIKPERRVRYYLIETLAKEVPKSQYLVKKEPYFISNTLRLISSNALGNPVAKALSAIYKRLYTNEEEAETWFHLYWSPVIESLRDPLLTSGTEQHLLPDLFKLSKTAFRLTVNELKDDIELFIICLNIGQQLAIEDETISQVLTYEMVETLLVKDKYKVKVFQLLTFSPKGSKQIPIHTFDLLRKYLELFFVDAEVETRNEFVSLFKQFLYRLKDSSYALKRDADKLSKSKYADESIGKYEAVEVYKSFINWLAIFLKTQIRPGSQYQRILSALKIFRQLVESNLDPSVPYKVEINYAFSIQLFDDELVDLLLSNLLSTYDDIRDEASYLLLKSNISSEKKSSIIDLGFDMLNDYGKSDSGAKLLQLSYVLFKDIEILKRLIEEIPLIENIKEAVRNPIDGYFNAIHLILKNVDSTDIQTERVLSIIERNWEIVKEILTNDSPEGCDQYGVGSAQLVLSYGWRSTKESTLVVQELLNQKLSDETLLRIGELTLDQLSTVRHRGAFSSVYPTFVKTIEKCSEQLPEQSKTWLDRNISLIQTKNQLITRRSGGLPFLITAIITVENDLFKYAFERLLEIAKVPVNEGEESEKMDLPQIHAFNCVKTLFIESQLSSLCAPFIYQALELSLATFSSKIWSVRNCSIMLFTALQNRLFGKKRISAGVFFSRFKGMKEILVDILKNFIDAKNLETLFPVLTILSKLEASPGYDGLEDFKPLLRSCLSVKYWKIRESASRALASLVSNATEESLLLWKSCSTKDQNQLHGYLLAIKELNGDVPDVVILDKLQELLVENPSYVTAKVYLEILDKHIPVKSSGVEQVLKSIYYKEISIKDVDGSKQLYLKVLFEAVQNDDKILDSALTSDYFELKLSAIEYCYQNNIPHPTLSHIVSSSEEWSYIRSKAIKLVKDISVETAFEYCDHQDIYGEDLKCSAFEFLGGAISSDHEHFQSWLAQLRSLSSDDEPFTVRIAALKSALRYLENSGESGEVRWYAYKFLTDDDDEIRELASDYFEKGVVPFVSSVRFTQSRGYEELAIKEILSFKPSFASLQNVKELFSVEKKNFYRNNIEQGLQLTHFLNKEGNKAIREHLQEIKLELLSFFRTNQLRLDWAIDEVLFEEIYISLHYLKYFDIELKELQLLLKETAFHKTLYRLLN